ncbi:50S ribosomal protein L17 [candidate division KSB1 bacterium]
MRHRKTVPKLGRTASHRKALLSNLSTALITAKKIRTTLAKAKALRSYIEPLITKARRGDLHSRRIVLKRIPHKDTVKELFDEVAPKYTDRPGGYTRITKIGRRPSDAADMALIELIGFEGYYKKKKTESKEKRQKKREEKEREAQKEAEEAQTAQAEATALSEVEEEKEEDEEKK